jgi:hypothetical protein
MIRIALCIAVLVIPPSVGYTRNKLLLSREVDGFEFKTPATISYQIAADGVIDVYVMEQGFKTKKRFAYLLSCLFELDIS